MLHQLATESVGHFVDWGFVHLSVGNLVVIVAMLVIFVLALVLPFPTPEAHEVREPPPEPGERTPPPRTTRQDGAPR